MKTHPSQGRSPKADFSLQACRRHVRQRGEIDIARRQTPAALDLQPRISAVDGLINGRARIDGAAVAPHLFIPALTGKVVGFPDQRFAVEPRGF